LKAIVDGERLSAFSANRLGTKHASVHGGSPQSLSKNDT
jgi:hypothetical protein